MNSLKISTACPLCRTELDTSAKDAEDDDDEDDTVSSISADYDEELIVDEYDDENPAEVSIEEIVHAFDERGYGLKEALSMLYMRRSRVDPKFTTEYFRGLIRDVDEILLTLYEAKQPAEQAVQAEPVEEIA